MGSGPFAEVVFDLPVSGPFTYRVPDGMSLVVGQRVSAPLGRRKLVGVATGFRSEPPAGITQIREILKPLESVALLTPALMTLGRWIAGTYLCSPGEAYAAMLPGGRRESVSDVGLGEVDDPAGSHVLSAEQEKALQAILGSSTPSIHYLHGVTGSGKTEIYLRAARETLAAGGGVICLVPEIALTHQTVERFAAALGREAVAVLHSRLTPSQRLKEWVRLLEGRASVAVGARSAIFAPVRSLGLILVDEEHDGAYKSSSVPRYHARQVAMARARAEGCRLIFGSATPSVEAYHFMRTGLIQRHALLGRPAGGALPAVRIVDMRRETGPLSTALVDAVRAVHAARRQSILFLNHRGFSYFFHCRSCDYEMRCRNCSVSMTYHKGRSEMVCHYCGWKARPLESCPRCGSLDVGYSGYGTEMVEEEIRRRLPDLVIRRLDADAVRRKGQMESTLREFRAGGIDVLLGTQMVAKGLDFPGVKLVGIVLADVGLQFPDFRAAERTFSLIVQVAGRAGRVKPDGEVIVQTFRPDHDAVRLAVAGDLESFYVSELDLRRELKFPPFRRLVRLVFRGKDRPAVEGVARSVAARLLTELGPAGEVLGPAECPLAVVNRQHRQHIIVRTVHLRPALDAVRRALAATVTTRGVRVDVDADPVDLL